MLKENDENIIINVKNLNHIYNEGNPFEKHALKNINITIKENEFIGLIGHTGSGKSTFVQHLNGLIKPSSGDIYIRGVKITKEGFKLKEIRKQVGLVFQYPEYQLFEESIYKDIAFGPTNLKLKDEEIHKRVVNAMEQVGLPYKEMKDRSPFELSGGQKRRVAIAGVLAMKPDILILDEPTAGLDPYARDEILKQIYKIYREESITIILVSHSMEDIARLAERVVVFSEGELVIDGKTREVFKRSKDLESLGLGVPQITKFMQKLRKKGFNINDDILTVEEAKIEMLKYLRRGKNV